MSSIMLAIGLIVLNTLWMGLLLMGLPGYWLIIASAAGVAWWTWGTAEQMFGLMTLGSITVLGVFGEVLEFVAGLAGARKAGGSKRGGIGALIGGIAGAILGTGMIPIPVLGSIIGACGGAFGGALIMELTGGRELRASVQAGIGAGKGRFWGTVAKLIVGAAIWLVVAIAAFI